MLPLYGEFVMPTNAQPFEVLFEFMNDMSEPVTLERTQSGQNGTASTGLTVWLQEQESISLVLDAGSTYYYLIKRLGCDIEAVISVKLWRNTQISASEVSIKMAPDWQDVSYASELEGIKVLSCTSSTGEDQG